MLTLLYRIAHECLYMLASAAPFVLFGLLAAGLVHVLMPRAAVVRWLGKPGLGGVVRAALVGIPLPVCSCGVVPIAIELRRKGASRPATLSFLTTTPESGLDSILLTWGMMGPVMAVARPVAAFFTALVGGVLSIAFPSRDDSATGPGEAEDKEMGGAACSTAGEACAGEGCGSATEPLEAGPEGEARGFTGRVIRPALRYGFVDLLDDLAFWLVLGLGAAGLLSALLPPELLRDAGLDRGFGAMLVMLVVGVPLYMCASASTPVAAALMLKGLSPGAALVFLLAGPATNAATLLLLVRHFGRRFTAVYLTAVVIGALASGLLLDAVTGGVLPLPTGSADEHTFGALEIASAAVLGMLLAWRLAAGAGRAGWRDLKGSLAGLKLLRPGA